MNIVYAVKIFAALLIVLFVTRLAAGKGLRLVMKESDWQAAWPAVAITLFVSCFSWKQPFFFVTFSIWAMLAPTMFGKSGDGRLPAYALLACISPQFSMEMENIGPLRDVLRLNAFRIIEIFILVPEAVRLLVRRDRPSRPSWLLLADVATVAYLAYWTFELYGHLNLSSVARESVGVVLDSVVPYYVLSRACADPEMRRRVLSMLLFGAVYQCMIGVVEGLSRHVLYAQLQYLYGIRWNIIGALTRGDFVRAQAAFSGPLILAVLALFGIGLWYVFKPVAKSRPYAVLGLILLGGLMATISRGPVLALLILVAGVACMRFMSARKFLVFSALAGLVVAGSWNFGLGDAVVSIVNSTSGGDKTADFNVMYRQELLRTSLALIQQSPWWGVPNYLEQMQDLRQGDGIVDLVNTYLIVTLNVGVVGLALFLVPFGIVLMKTSSSASLEQPYALRRERIIWIPLTLSIMAAVFTVSPVSIIQPILVWVVAIALGGLQEGLTPTRRTGMATAPAMLAR